MEILDANYDFIEVTIEGVTYIVCDVKSKSKAEAYVKAFRNELKRCKNKKERDYVIEDWSNFLTIK